MRIMKFENAFVDVIKDSPSTALHSKINAAGRDCKEDAFFLCDLGDIIYKYNTWAAELPRVKPFYAVKCNDDQVVLSLLHKLGAGFDCASKAEIQKVLQVGASTSSIIYANPCKQRSHIKFAAKTNVPLMTFDNETELHKVKSIYPTAQLVLRILPPVSDKCQCPLGIKFGVEMKETLSLLQLAKSLDLNVVGVSFHVGSGCYDAEVYASAVEAARLTFDQGAVLGYKFTLLDIGGGFPGSKNAKITFQEICAVLRPALDTYFPESMQVNIIAEPGRFMVASAFALACNVIGTRREANGKMMYYINDGVYGSFNCILFDHQEVIPEVLSSDSHCSKKGLLTSSVWGPTCDGLDLVTPQCLLPELETGNWLAFRDMGAYTLAAASTFNGMPKSKIYYAVQEKFWDLLNDRLEVCEQGNVSPLKMGCHAMDPFSSLRQAVQLEADIQ